ncbi:MAG: site-specific DNA-methyltransferase [Thermoplasmata archaeon]|nr:site-specific DNA-methyltransferase [Thermoplasmata archaeon]
MRCGEMAMNNIKVNDLFSKFEIKDMNDWENVGADLIITDPPFGIEFSGKNGNYHRKVEYVVDGYVEWAKEEYGKKIKELLVCIEKNLNSNGQALIFSGWNNSNVIHDRIIEFPGLKLMGKMYWCYNFAPACKVRPAHNVYEIFWVTKGEQWTYNLRCNTHHCKKGEPNLTTLSFKRDYKVRMPKYPTRLPFRLLQCIIEHFSNKNDLIFDPLCGSGMVGIVAFMLGRRFVMGDLNPNGKTVYQSLLDYYLNKNGLIQDQTLMRWWEK